jgi:hypothetical protein
LLGHRRSRTCYIELETGAFCLRYFAQERFLSCLDFLFQFLSYIVVRQGEAKFRGGWDSIHIFEVKKEGKEDMHYTYKLTSTIMLNLMAANGPVDVLNLGGNVTREV